MQPPQPIRPDVVNCGNCSKEVRVDGHLGSPSAEVPDYRVHRVSGETSTFTVRCPMCGHYTVFESKS